MTRVDGLFKDWKFDSYTATSPDNRYVVWICNGFFFFADYKPVVIRTQAFLAGMPLLVRWRLWRELKRERRRQALSRLEPPA